MNKNSTPEKPDHETYFELYEERRHLENMVNTRFNFFLIIFGIILATLFTLKNLNQFRTVLSIGILIEVLLAIVTARAQRKLIFYLETIRRIKGHAERAANKFANRKWTFFLIRCSCNRIVGYVIPIVICVVLIISLPLSRIIFNTITSNKPENEVKIELNMNNEPLEEFTINLDNLKVIKFNLTNYNCDDKMNSHIRDTSRKSEN
jgi:hypothetical protein